jgi:hypothetical protein
MAGWDDDDFEVPTTVVVPKGKWEGEDEDDEDIPVRLPGGGANADGRMIGMPIQRTRSRRLGPG